MLDALAAYGDFDVAYEALERLWLQLSARAHRRVQKTRALRAAARLRFVEGRNRIDPAARPQFLQRLQNIALAIAEIRTDAKENRVRAEGLPLSRYGSPSV
jgi:hypothetical protein